MERFEVEEGLELRQFEEGHADALFRLVDQEREHLARWCPTVANTRSLEGIRRYIRTVREQFDGNGRIQSGIWSGRDLAGFIGFNRLDLLNKSVEIGYWLGAGFQGRGIMTKACRTLIDHAFGKLGLNRVEMRCAPENHRSRAIPERLGFTLEGIVRQSEWLNDRFADQAIYGILAEEWKAHVPAEHGRGSSYTVRMSPEAVPGSL